MAYVFNPFTGTFDNTGNADSSAGFTLGIAPIASRYYFGWGVTPGTAGTRVATASRVYYILFFNPTLTTWTRVGTRIATGTTGSARMGLYEVGDTGLPTTRLQDFGTVTNTSGDKEITISTTLEPGSYYLALVSDNTPTFAGHFTDLTAASYVFGADSPTAVTVPALWYETSTGNVLPSTANTTLTQEDASLRRPMIWLRKV